MKTIKVSIIILLMLTFASAGTNKPGWPLEVITWDLTKAHPNVMYDFRLGVIGGTYPYHYQFLQAPDSMHLDSITGAITWTPTTPSTTNSISIKITDRNNQYITHNWNIEVTTNGFYFVDSAKGNDANSGTISAPFKTFDKAYKGKTKGDIIYLRAGTYHTDSGATFEGTHHPKMVLLTSDNPQAWFGYPGETVRFNGQFTGTVSDGISNFEFVFSDKTEPSKRIIQNVSFVNGGYHTIVFWGATGTIVRKCIFGPMISSGAENPAYFFSAASADDIKNMSRKKIIIQENEMTGLKTNDAGAATVFYDVERLLYEDNYIHNIGGNGINIKQKGYYCTVRNNIFDSMVVAIVLMAQSGSEAIDVEYNLLTRSKERAMYVGYQVGYLKDVFIHHNTFTDAVVFRHNIHSKPESNNYNFYYNIVKTNDFGLLLESSAVLDSAKKKLKCDNNLYNCFFNSAQAVMMVDGLSPRYTLAQWKALGFDSNSIFVNPQLDANYNLPQTSPYFGIYGRNFAYNQSPMVDSVKILGGDTLRAGSTYTITWVAKDDKGVKRSSIRFSANNGTLWTPISNITGNGQSYSWTTTSNLSSKNCLVKVIAYDEQGDSGFTVSTLFVIKMKKKTISLNASAVDDTTALLTWNPEVLSGSDAARIGIAIDTSKCAKTITAPVYDTLLRPLTPGSLRVSGLLTRKTWYFSAFVLDTMGDWSAFNDTASHSAYLADMTPPENHFTIKVSQIDTSSSVLIKWNSSGQKLQNGDTVGIWYQLDSFPQKAFDPAAKLLKFYGISDGFDTLKQLQLDHYYCFGLFVRDSSGNWSAGTDSSRTRVIPIDYSKRKPSAVTVSGGDTLHAGLKYTISWAAQDTGIARFSIFYNTTNGVNWDTIGSTINERSIQWTAPDLSSKNCQIKVTAYYKLGDSGSVISPRFSIKNKKKTLTLNATAQGDNSVLLTWNPEILDGSDAVGVGIIYGTSGFADKIGTLGYDTVYRNLETRSYRITGLLAGKKWYFRAFVFDSFGDWSVPNDTAADSVYLADITPPENHFNIIAAQVDTSTARLLWRNTSGLQMQKNDTIGIWYRSDMYPQKAGDTLAKLLGLFSAADGVDTLKQLQLDHYYYFCLFVRDSSGNWSTGTDTSRTRIILTDYSRKNPNAINLSAGDTAHLYGNTLQIWPSNDFIGVITDTVDLWNAASVVINGFTGGTEGYQFRTGGQIIRGALNVSVLLPGGVANTQPKLLYRFDNINNRWLLDTSSHMITTAEGPMVISAIKDLEFPFIVLSDTLRPKLSAQIRSKIIAFDENFSEEIQLTENTDNCSIKLFASAGGESFLETGTVDTLPATGKPGTRKFTATIPAGVASWCNGVQVMLTASDGVCSDTIFISRPVARPVDGSCDAVVVSPMTWTPILTTAIPAYRDLASVISHSTGEEGNWLYNRKEMRIIKWHDSDPVKENSGGWQEYGSVPDSLFAISSGNVVWIKSLNALNISYGESTVPSLLDTVSLTVNSGEWMDFSVPFGFDMKLRDFLDADGNGIGGFADSVEIYSWVKDDSSYRTKPFYLSRVAELQSTERVLKAHTSYTVYNPQKKAVALNFPGIQTDGGRALGKLQIKTIGWSVRIDVSSGEQHLSPIYCGWYPSGEERAIWYPLSPSFEAHSAVGVVDTITGKTYGHCIYGGRQPEGKLYRIWCGGTQKASTTLEIGSICNSTDTLIAGFIDPVTLKWSDNFQTGDDGISKSVYLAVGNAEFKRSVYKLFAPTKAAITRIANINRNRYIIHYSLPPGKYDFIRFTLYDLKGRKLLTSFADKNCSAGLNNYPLYYANLASKMYVFIMDVQFSDTKKMQRSIKTATLYR